MLYLFFKQPVTTRISRYKVDNEHRSTIYIRIYIYVDILFFPTFQFLAPGPRLSFYQPVFQSINVKQQHELNLKVIIDSPAVFFVFDPLFTIHVVQSFRCLSHLVQHLHVFLHT